MCEALKIEMETYEKNKEELIGKAEGKFVLIKNDEVVGIYENRMDAIKQGYEKYGHEAFLVKQIFRIETPSNFVSNLLGI
ncbi:MAG: hypothetical protein JW984_05545 [Deltaproteobacteria bacterium]|uniref:DUF5678 domain-containing protein n=1 Tax=Candidatus Zymogenus saltonus TaxID=2844893 RepID=A0A9D8KC97_9DELT|nr:hypothetical protein [Candidatus Zymogenus saltonus]